MDEPLTWRAIQAIVALLRRIDGSDGWHTSLGASPIHDDRSSAVDPRAPHTWVVASEIDTDEVATGRSRRSVTGEERVIIEFAVPSASASPELVAHRARADIVRALSADPRGLATGLTKLAVESSLITDAVLSGTDLVIAQVVVRASLTEILPQPA